MSREEDLVRSTTRAIASAVREVPPLRLEPGADEARSSAHASRRRRGSDRARHWWSWGAPLATAAVIVALAVTLTLVRDMPDGSTGSSASPAQSAGLGGIPRYYAALIQFSGNSNPLSSTAQDGIVVGDSVTGKRIAKIAPPAHTTFQSVTAAADDRTFVVHAVSASRGPLSWPFTVGATVTDRWYLVRLAPGSTNPARLTPLPVKPQSWIAQPGSHDYSQVTPGEVFATALSPSGQELAVLDIPHVAGGVAAAQTWQEVKVFSVATGQLLHDWTGHDPTAAFGFTNMWVPSLTWIDGGGALALATGHTVLPAGKETGTLRRLNVNGPARGDLTANSTVIWSGELTGNDGYGCYAMSSWPPLISADGNSVSCTNYDELKSGPSRWMASIVTDPLPPGAAAAFKPRFDYKVTSPLDQQGRPLAAGADLSLMWVSPSGGTLIGTWHYIASRPPAIGLHFGVISHGKFIPLQLPSDFANLGPGQITW